MILEKQKQKILAALLLVVQHFIIKFTFTNMHIAGSNGNIHQMCHLKPTSIRKIVYIHGNLENDSLHKNEANCVFTDTWGSEINTIF